MSTRQTLAVTLNRSRLPSTEWEPLVKKLRSAQNADCSWGQTKKAMSDAYATGQALYALAQVEQRRAMRLCAMHSRTWPRPAGVLILAAPVLAGG
jgi:hypothetical protein